MVEGERVRSCFSIACLELIDLRSARRYTHGLWTDFDCAIITDRQQMGETDKEATGTRMFMAEDILFQGPIDASRRNVFWNSQAKVSSKLDLTASFGEHPTEIQKRFSAELNETAVRHVADREQFMKLSRLSNSDARPRAQCGATDIESLFWIVATYVLRARREPLVPDHDKIRTSNAFRSVQARYSFSTLLTVHVWASAFNEEPESGNPSLSSFGEVALMLEKLAQYFAIPWDKHVGDRFHAHNLFQALLVPVINKLRQNDIHVDKFRPLEVEGLNGSNPSCKGPYGKSSKRIKLAEEAYDRVVEPPKRKLADMYDQRENDSREPDNDRPQKRITRQQSSTLEDHGGSSCKKEKSKGLECDCTVDFDLATLVQRNNVYLLGSLSSDN